MRLVLDLSTLASNFIPEMLGMAGVPNREGLGRDLGLSQLAMGNAGVIGGGKRVLWRLEHPLWGQIVSTESYCKFMLLSSVNS